MAHWPRETRGKLRLRFIDSAFLPAFNGAARSLWINLAREWTLAVRSASRTINYRSRERWVREDSPRCEGSSATLLGSRSRIPRTLRASSVAAAKVLWKRRKRGNFPVADPQNVSSNFFIAAFWHQGSLAHKFSLVISGGFHNGLGSSRRY